MTAPASRGDFVRELRDGGGVLLGSLLGVGVGVSGLLFYTSGIFVADLAKTIGLTRTQFGLASLCATTAVAIANPLVGWLVDRFGVRRPAAFGLVSLAIGFFALGALTESVAAYVALQTVTAFFAAASGPIAYNKAISAWFERHRGAALGITMTGIGIAAAIVPPLLARTIAGHGWRTGYYVLGAVALVGLVPLLALVRLPPSYRSSSPAAAGGDPAVPDFHRSSVFWMLMAAFTTLAVGFAGLLQHFVPMLTDLGVEPVRAGSLAGVIGVAVIVSRIVVGLLVDRFFAPRVAVGTCLLCIAGCAVLLVYGAPGAVFAAIALGAAMGAEIDLIGFLVARYFGLRAFGRAYGWQYAAFIVAGGVSPLWMGILFDRTGTYRSSLPACMVILSFAALLFLRLPGYAPAGTGVAPALHRARR
mgnify:CR=1 FL=1